MYFGALFIVVQQLLKVVTESLEFSCDFRIHQKPSGMCELLKDFLGVKCQMIGNKFITEQVCKEERSL